MREIINIFENKIPQELESFISTLKVDDVGYDIFDNYVVLYEGFSSICMDDVINNRNGDFESVYNEVYQDFKNQAEALGFNTLIVENIYIDFGGDIIYSVYKR